MEDFNEFQLEGENTPKNQIKSKKIKKLNVRPRLNSTWHFVDAELEEIIGASNKNDDLMEDSFSDEEGSSS